MLNLTQLKIRRLPIVLILVNHRHLRVSFFYVVSEEIAMAMAGGENITSPVLYRSLSLRDADTAH